MKIPEMSPTAVIWLTIALLIAWPSRAHAERTDISLNGMWSVEESVTPDAVPASFTHTAPVPGLTHQAQPAFPDVDNYETLTYLKLMIKKGELPASELCEGMGRTRQTRNYFWYRKTFTAPIQTMLATLVVNKAQFGTAVWLNGRKLGEHLGCFTAGRFDLSPAINWQGENQLVIRIGAHPGVMPPSAMWGNDVEKSAWTPGIYDNVSLIFADNPAIESLQVAPRLADSAIVVVTRLKNYGPACTTQLVQQVKTWKGMESVGLPMRMSVDLAAGEEKVITQTIPMPNATLWTTENPFLYILDTSSGGDSCTTRFGMREFHFDTTTRLGYLNGKVCYWRGSSITLHRFFADPLSKGHPWDEAWVRRLLVEIPRRMHWNAFRLCVGPVPQLWLDIADEAGILLEYEFPIWPSTQGAYLVKLWSEEALVSQLKEFVQDNWNHPSVVLWDMSNEFGYAGVKWDFLAEKLLPAVRALDLSHRPWENSTCPPQDPNDPFEVHPYQVGLRNNPPEVCMNELETIGPWPQMGTSLRSVHAAIINEYGYLWLHRDGTPTQLSKGLYKSMNLDGPEVKAEQRFEEYAYLLAGQTEFFRAHRSFAGVMYLAYLDGDVPGASTCDNFRNPETLTLEPHFADYMGEAFKPLGVYISFWQRTLAAGSKRSYQIMLVNDTHETAQGRLELAWQQEDGRLAGSHDGKPLTVAPVGQTTYEIELATPTVPGKYVLVAKAFWDGQRESPTVARRKVQIVIQSDTK